jgi:uncharacterized protein involved in exopolysaccharide biosynthesis
MSNEVNSQNPDADEINLWDLLEVVKSGWRWIAGGVGVGLVGAVAAVLVVPPEFEATALVQPAYVGLAPGGKGTEVEPVAQILERLKLPTFYSDELVTLCQVKATVNPLDALAKAVKPTLVKGNSLIQLTYRAASPEVAQACLAGVVAQITKSQAAIATPIIDTLEEQLQLTKQQLSEAEKFETQLEKKALTLDPSDVKFSQSMLMLNAALSKREEVSKLRRQYADQSLQLIPPMTQPAKLFEPIYAPQKAVFPKKSLTALGGVLGGGFVGLLGLFVSLSWRRYRTSHS